MDIAVKQKLENSGFDVDGALARFVNNESLYMMFMKKFPNDENYAKIEGELQAENYDDAYAAVHALKGVAGNLGINEVFDISVRLLALMKNKESETDLKTKAMDIYAELKVAFEKASAVIGEI